MTPYLSINQIFIAFRRGFITTAELVMALADTINALPAEQQLHAQLLIEANFTVLFLSAVSQGER